MSESLKTAYKIVWVILVNASIKPTLVWVMPAHDAVPACHTPCHVYSSQL